MSESQALNIISPLRAGSVSSPLISSSLPSSLYPKSIFKFNGKKDTGSL
ncbi:1596_t:CDS:2 [Diversispora eburnea]|uniref:1596_t:CDS:1 n=1 Tax=Diversispora eburnea TaxID=1213867 RepID=A0A9N8V3K1_9GLOM|nr:1596_t:CDS:2 [Diversispora eburnea]